MCILDRKPRPPLDATQRAALVDLAAIAVDQMQLRQQQLRSVAMKLFDEQADMDVQSKVDAGDVPSWLADAERKINEPQPPTNEAAYRAIALAAQAMQNGESTGMTSDYGFVRSLSDGQDPVHGSPAQGLPGRSQAPDKAQTWSPGTRPGMQTKF